MDTKFNIFNKASEIIDTATSRDEAFRLVDFHNASKREQAPFHTSPAV